MATSSQAGERSSFQIGINRLRLEDTPGLGSIGTLREDVDWLDQAVEHALKVREERPWRDIAVE